jgi:hypothetical protein
MPALVTTSVYGVCAKAVAQRIIANGKKLATGETVAPLQLRTRK